jgi:CIC family chloride channel protein
VDLEVLRRFVRVAPSERQRVWVLTIVVGALSGLAAVGFHLTIRFAERQMIDRAVGAGGHWWVLWTVLVPVFGGIVSGILLAYVVPDARGSGVPQVKVAYGIKGGRLPFRQVVGKFTVSSLQIGSGASLGREGPTVQICAGIASLVGRAAALSRDNLRRMLPVGAAAGIAAAFNAPIAAVTFTIEEVVGDLDHTVLAGVVVAAALAAAIEHAALGARPIFAVPAGLGVHHGTSMLLYLLLGVLAAVAALAFTDSLLALRSRLQRRGRLPVWARPALGGLVTGGLAVVALGWFDIGGITGGGYDTLTEALNGGVAWRVMMALSAMKLVATVFSYSSGGAGGIFAPALFIGGMLGGGVGALDVALFGHDKIEVGAFVLVGMGAVFAGIIRAPITSVLIIYEMTGNYNLILPLMVANMIAYVIARHVRPVPIYEALLAQDGIDLPHPGQPPAHVLDLLTVADVMTTNPTTISADDRAEDALAGLTDAAFSTFPAVDGAGRLVGLVSEAKLRRSVAEGRGDALVAGLAGRRDRLTPGQPLSAAIIALERNNSRQLAVVHPGRPDELLGIIALADILRAQARALDPDAATNPPDPHMTEASTS